MKAAKKIDLKSSHHRRKFFYLCMVTDESAGLIVVIVWQYKQILNRYVIYLKVIQYQLYQNFKKSTKKWFKKIIQFKNYENYLQETNSRSTKANNVKLKSSPPSFGSIEILLYVFICGLNVCLDFGS